MKQFLTALIIYTLVAIAMIPVSLFFLYSI